MHRFNFGTFIVDEGNRLALEVCRDVANLRPVDPQPVMLLGDEGCGKTHLLYSIVNSIRAGSSKAGLAYITAYDFDHQVRALVQDPTPVRQKQHAVLLVDQLEGFAEDDVDELEAVVRIFIDNGHAVVLASSVHPGRLPQLSRSFRELLENGKISRIEVKSPESPRDVESSKTARELESLLEERQREIEQLRELLRGGRVERTSDLTAEVETLRSQLDAERSGAAVLAGKAEAAERLSASIQEELISARSELDRLRGKEGEAAELLATLEAVRAQAANELHETRTSLRRELQEALTEAKENLETAREMQRRLEEARADAKNQAQAILDIEAHAARSREETGELRDTVLRLESQLTDSLRKLESANSESDDLSSALGGVKQELVEYREERTTLAEEFATLRAQLESTTIERDTTRAELAVAKSDHEELVQKAEILLGQIETARTEFTEKQQDHLGRIQELENSLAQQTAIAIDPQALESANNEADRLRVEIESAKQDVDKLRAEIETANCETERVRTEHESAKAEANQLRAEIESVRASLGSETERLSNQIRDLECASDALREHASTVEHENDGLRSIMMQLQQERDGLRMQAGDLEQKFSESQAQAEALTQACHALRGEIDQATRAHEDDEARQAQLEQQRDEVLAAIAEANRETDMARKRFEEADKARMARENELDALSREAAAQVAAAIAQTGEVEGRLARLRHSYDRLERATRDAGAQLDAVAGIIKQVGAELNAVSPDENPGAVDNSLPLLAPIDLLALSGDDGTQFAGADQPPLEETAYTEGVMLLPPEEAEIEANRSELDAATDEYENEQTSI